MKLRCLVIDDEQLARELLKDYISQVPLLELVKSCKNPLEAIEYIETGTIDLIFLDIQMPELTGNEFMKTFNNLPMVIFTTAYSEYALEGYELEVLDYLVKPFSFERFLKAVHKAFSQIKSETGNRTYETKYITIPADHKIYRVALDEILYIEGLKEYVSFYTKEKRIISLASLKHLEETLPPDKFLRIHKSYIIPVDKVKAIEGNMVDIGIKKLPIGRIYRETTMNRLIS